MVKPWYSNACLGVLLVKLYPGKFVCLEELWEKDSGAHHFPCQASVSLAFLANHPAMVTSSYHQETLNARTSQRALLYCIK